MGENERIATDFLKHVRGTFPHIIDFDYSMNALYQADSWPNALIIDEEGRIVAHEYVLKKGIALLEEALDQAAPLSGPAVGLSLADKHDFCQGGICYDMPGATHTAPALREDFPAIAVSPDDIVYIAFTSNEAGDNNIYVETYRRGQEIERLQITATPSDEYGADVAVSRDGIIWLAWTSNLDSIYSIYASQFEEGSLSEPERISRPDRDAFHPRIAVDENGSAWITYYEWIPEGAVTVDRDIFLRRYENGKWSKALEVSPMEPAQEDHSDPAIVRHGGEIHVAWSYDYHPSIKGNTLDASRPTIFIQKISGAYEKAGSLFCIGSYGKDRHIKDFSPALASDGKILACAWEAQKSIAVRRMENGSWTDTEKISRTQAPCNTPAVTVTPAGTYVCYSQLTNTGWRIVGRILAGGIWQEPRYLDDGEGDCRLPALGVDSTHRVWLSYTCQSGECVRVRLKAWD